MPADIRVGDLRWEVTIARRRHETHPFDDDAPELLDAYSARQVCWAKIEPVGLQSFLLGQQTDLGSVTHRITVRWRPTLDDMDVVLRTRALPDSGAEEETYRIHRMTQHEGRQRWLVVEAELETRRG